MFVLLITVNPTPSTNQTLNKFLDDEARTYLVLKEMKLSRWEGDENTM